MAKPSAGFLYQMGRSKNHPEKEERERERRRPVESGRVLEHP
jgi:hypothetical protein